MSDPWFVVRPVDGSTYVIDEPGHVRSHLILGSESAVLFDTGTGVRPIRPVVESLTGLPVLVVSSHHHFDHVGGNHEFDEVAIHAAGADLLAAGPTPAWLRGYWTGVAAYVERQHADRAPGSAIGDTTPRPLPAGLDPDRPGFVSAPATRTLLDGDVLALGGRDLVVAHVPGHTRDAICLVDADHGFLFGGDAVDVGPIYAHLPTADLPQFAASLRQLAERLPVEVTEVLSPHGGTGRAPVEVVSHLARALRRTVADGLRTEPGVDCFGQPATVTRIDPFDIYTPAAGRQDL